MTPLCNVCGRPVGLRNLFRCLLFRRRLTYPLRRLDGSRAEETVSWLCRGCSRRAAGLRRRGEAETPPDSPRE